MSFHSKGFTLIEMLITIAVIGILATIALPSYMHYIERGHLAQAHNELVNMNNHIKTEKIKNPSGYKITNDPKTKLEDKIKNLIKGYRKDPEVNNRYDFDVYVPAVDSSAYNLVATPKSSSGYTKAVWMSSAGDAYRCKNANSAKKEASIAEYKSSGDCEKIGG